MKKELLERFNGLYPKSRLLAIQLNGFSHKVFYDNGKAGSTIKVEEHSGYHLIGDVGSKVSKLLGSIAHYSYQGNPEEIIYVKPDER